MTKVKIYGAGSIGNHLAQASRRIGWDVIIVDPDEKALARTKNDIYPARYGSWDPAIGLCKLGEEPKAGFDVIMLGTPPDVRMKLAMQCLEEKPKVILLEKPLCSPSLDGLDIFLTKLAQSESLAVIGYDHAVSKAVKTAEDLIKSRDFGKVLALDVEFRETWKGIFRAHPWLSGPEDTYLGYWEKGGGAACEHSHATNLWQHFANFLGLGKVSEVSAVMQMAKAGKAEYDSASFLNLSTDAGFAGRVAQDVVTEPVKKSVRIQFENGFLEILVGGFPGGDLIKFQISGKNAEEIKIEKKRPDDFYEEVVHIRDLMEGKSKIEDSPISILRGADTMKVVAAAHKSRQEKKTIIV